MRFYFKPVANHFGDRTDGNFMKVEIVLFFPSNLFEDWTKLFIDWNHPSILILDTKKITYGSICTGCNSNYQKGDAIRDKLTSARRQEIHKPSL